MCGRDFVKPNMHLHLHLRECLFDYGPFHSYWLFAFERFNFNIGNIHTNCRNIEVQIMRNIVKGNKLTTMSYDVQDDVKCKYPLLNDSTESCVKFDEVLSEVPLGPQSYCEQQWSDLSNVVVPKTKHVDGLDSVEKDQLEKAYQAMYIAKKVELPVVKQVKVFKNVQVGSEKYGSMAYGNGKRHGRVMASWTNDNGEIDFDADIRPCHIKRFVGHNVCIVEDGKRVFREHVFAEVEWLKRHVDPGRVPPSVTVWDHKMRGGIGASSYLPVQRIHSKFAWVEKGRDRLYVSAVPTRVLI